MCSRRLRYASACSLAVMLSVCGQGREGSAVLVSIDGESITSEDLDRFRAKLPDHLDSPHEGEKGARDLLQTMIDRELLVIESKARGYHELPKVRGRFEEIQSKWLVDRMMVRDTATDPYQVSEEEARTFFEEYDLGKAVFAAQIVCATRAQCLETLRKVKAGADFAALARAESIADNAALGGEIRRYLGFGDLSPALREALWELGVGEITETPVEAGSEYGIYRILDIRRRPFSEMAPTIVQVLRKRQVAEERRAIIAVWEERLGAVFHGPAIEALLGSSEGTPLTAEQNRLHLASYRGGQVTLEAAARALTRQGRLHPSVSDSAALVQALRNTMLGTQLLAQAAREQGLDETEEFTAFCEAELRELLAKELWRQEARYKVVVAEGEIERVYRDSVHLYMQPAWAEVVEILVDDRGEAERFVEMVEAGDDISVLASRHTQRPPVMGKVGRFHVHEADEELGPLFSVAIEAHEGELVGPVEIDGRYSVFRLVAKQEAQPMPFERARARIELAIRKVKEGQLFDAFFAELRDQYRHRVTWNDTAIRALATRT